MSFDRDKLRAMGGFDPAIGTGTVARGGDDLAAFFTVIASGFQLVYQPTALVWHHHQRDFGSLVAQAYGYGVGPGAYLSSSLCRHPSSSARALRRAPQVWRTPSAPIRLGTPIAADSDWPRKLTRLERKGLCSDRSPMCAAAGRPGTFTARPRTNRSMPNPVPILLYHSVSADPPSWIAPFSVSPATFATHLDEVVSSGRQPLTVSQYVDGLARRRRCRLVRCSSRWMTVSPTSPTTRCPP